MEKSRPTIKDPSLISQIGHGPWEKSNGKWVYDRTDDLRLLEKHGFNEMVNVSKPDSTSSLEAYKGFFKISDLQTYFFGVNYKYDLFTTQEFLDLAISKNPKRAQLQLALRDKSVIPWRSVVVDNPFSLSRSLEQIRYMGIQFPGHDSTEATAVLHNIAKKGKRIAVIVAHGTPNTNQELVVQNNNNAFVKASTIIDNISREYGSFLSLRYEAIYFSSCNRNTKLETQGSVEAKIIPTIIHTGIHWADSEVAPATVYWPK